jgi:hypothetical protein
MLSNVKRTSRAQYAFVAVLLGLLVATVVLAVIGWNSADSSDVSPAGYVALVLGVIFSLVFG